MDHGAYFKKTYSGEGVILPWIPFIVSDPSLPIEVRRAQSHSCLQAVPVWLANRKGKVVNFNGILVYKPQNFAW